MYQTGTSSAGCVEIRLPAGVAHLQEVLFFSLY